MLHDSDEFFEIPLKQSKEDDAIQLDGDQGFEDRNEESPVNIIDYEVQNDEEDDTENDFNMTMSSNLMNLPENNSIVE